VFQKEGPSPWPTRSLKDGETNHRGMLLEKGGEESWSTHRTNKEDLGVHEGVFSSEAEVAPAEPGGEKTKWGEEDRKRRVATTAVGLLRGRGSNRAH